MSHRNSKIKMRHLTIAHMPMNITVVIGQVSPDCRLSQEPDGIGDADQPDCSLIVTQLTTARH